MLVLKHLDCAHAVKWECEGVSMNSGLWQLVLQKWCTHTLLVMWGISFMSSSAEESWNSLKKLQTHMQGPSVCSVYRAVSFVWLFCFAAAMHRCSVHKLQGISWSLNLNTETLPEMWIYWKRRRMLSSLAKQIGLQGTFHGIEGENHGTLGAGGDGSRATGGANNGMVGQIPYSCVQPPSIGIYLHWAACLCQDRYALKLC